MANPHLPNIPLPLPSNGPPPGYDWADRSTSALSTTTAFATGIDRRDGFLGQTRCVICGAPEILQYCYIIPESETATGSLKRAKVEPRNGLLMCPTHHVGFDKFIFFIRYFPDIRKFIFINYSGSELGRQFHGKSIGLNIDDHHVPFPSLFIIHEMRVRGFNPFKPIEPDIIDNPPYQDWILSVVYLIVQALLNVINHTTPAQATPPRNYNSDFNLRRQVQLGHLASAE